MNVTTTEHDVIQKLVSANVNTTQLDATANFVRKDFMETRLVVNLTIANHVRVSLPTNVFSSDRMSNVLTVRKVTSVTTVKNVLTDISVIQKENSENAQGTIIIIYRVHSSFDFSRRLGVRFRP